MITNIHRRFCKVPRPSQRPLLKYFHHHVPLTQQASEAVRSTTTAMEIQEPIDKLRQLLLQLIDEPETVRKSLLRLKELHGKKDFDEKVSKSIHLQFENDPYYLSMFQCATNHKQYSKTVNRFILQISHQSELSEDQKFAKLMDYLHTLGRLIPADDFTLRTTLSDEVLNALRPIVPRASYKEFFIALLNVNAIFTEDSNSFLQKISYELKHGNAEEFYTFMNAKLPSQTSKHDTSLVFKNVYSYGMLSKLLRTYNEARNSPQFSKTISLIFQKIDEDNTKANKSVMLSRAYDQLMAHVVKKYGLKPSLLILQDMQNNSIPISNRLLFILLSGLSFDSDLKNFAIFTNAILDLYADKKQQLDPTAVQLLTNEMLKVMQNSEFSNSDLKVIMGYMLSFFREAGPLLEQLRLAPLAYNRESGNGNENNHDDHGDDHGISNLPKANVRTNLKTLSYPPITALEQVYKACFRHMNFNKTMTIQHLKELYISYRDTALEIQSKEKNDPVLLAHHPLSSQNMNYKILKLFMRQLAYRFSSYQGAGELLDDFTENFKLKNLPNSYIFDMVIKNCLWQGDVIGAFKWFDKMINYSNVKPNMKPLVSLINTAYDVGSSNSRNIAGHLAINHLAPLIASNVHTSHLTPRLKEIITGLKLESHFNMSLPAERYANDVIPGRNPSEQISFEKEFNVSLIDSLASDYTPVSTEVAETASNSNIETELQEDYMEFVDELEGESDRMAELEDEPEINDKSSSSSSAISDQHPVIKPVYKAVTSAITSPSTKSERKSENKTTKTITQKKKADDSRLLSKVRETPKTEYKDEMFSSDNFKSSNPRTATPTTTTAAASADEVVETVSSMRHGPAYDQFTTAEDRALFKKRKQFVEMLSGATNDELVPLLLKFLQDTKNPMIFYRSNKDYRNAKASWHYNGIYRSMKR